MTEISPDVEAVLAGMSDTDFAVLVAKTRAPDSTEALRTAAAVVLTGDALDSFVKYADASKYIGADGNIDEQMVLTQLRALTGAGPEYVTTGQRVNYGQTSGHLPGKLPGDDGRAALNKRFGTPLKPEVAQRNPPPTSARGAAGKAAAAKRFATPRADGLALGITTTNLSEDNR